MPTLRIRPGPNNDKLLANLDQQKFSDAAERGKVSFSMALKRELVRKTHSLTRTGTGDLARRWAVRSKKGSIIITNTAKTPSGKSMAGFIEFGTKAHFVRPRPGRVGLHGRPAALAWRKSGKGPVSAFKSSFNPKNYFFSRGHRVRGIKARKILPRSLRSVGHKLAEFINFEVRKVLFK